jgi:D-tyrosyl-tRNA(Tyr) deacylase
MKLVIQRVKNANVKVKGTVVGSIGHGLLGFLGITHDDTKEKASGLAKKLVHLRIFEDEGQKLNRSLLDVKGSALIISQFTLYSDCSQGRRPSFVEAAKPEMAKPLYEFFVQEVKKNQMPVSTGIFGAEMEVSLINDGPVTLILEL